MPSNPLPHRQNLLTALLAAAFLVAWPATAARAADAHAPAKPATPVARAEAPAASAAPHAAAAHASDAAGHGARAPKGEAAAPHGAAAKAEPAAAEDPLDRLRERLVERLGARRPADARHPNVLQVASRAPGEMQVAAGSHAPRKAASARHETGHGAGNTHGAAAVHGAQGGGHAAGHAHWTYQGETGPQSWGSLRPEFVACSTGTRQSPIDIRDGFTLDLDPVRFSYRPTGFSVIDNGHTVQVNLPSGQFIEALGRRYELVQFHFHRPSEERINGRAFDMVVHLVHKDLEGRLAVVAVLLDRGSAHAVVQSVWNNLPLEKGEALPASATIDLNELLPADRRYFQYMGSLTTPPCTEGVLWMVMQQPATVSHEQIALFSRLYPMNARPIQSASGRVIKQSN